VIARVLPVSPRLPGSARAFDGFHGKSLFLDSFIEKSEHWPAMIVESLHNVMVADRDDPRNPPSFSVASCYPGGSDQFRNRSRKRFFSTPIDRAHVEVRGVQQIKLPLQVKVEKSLHGAVRRHDARRNSRVSPPAFALKPVLVGRGLGRSGGKREFFLDLVGSFRLGASVSYATGPA